MGNAANFQTAVSVLKTILARAQSDEQLTAITHARDEVLVRYQSTFDSNRLPSLTEEEFRQFLHFKNNRHWISLQRMGPAICSDMNRLRQALTILLNEDRPVRDRLNELVPSTGPAYVPRLSKAVLTPILLICHPDRYGVWNQISEGALKTLDIWPEFHRGEPFGDRYVKVNAILNDLAQDVKVDLWTLDALMWRIEAPIESPIDDTQLTAYGAGSLPEGESLLPQTFGLERHLQEFLRDNWARTELGKNWNLYEEDGDPEAGYEYPCSVGRIDLLARHQREPRWLVIELKRNQSSDQTVGQVLRYMGWVAKHLAQSGESVEGLVIAHKADEPIGYAIAAAPNVRLQLYEVSFHLRESTMVGEDIVEKS